MIFADPNARLSREEAARALSLPLTLIDAITHHSSVKAAKDGSISVPALEEFFRDSLLRLYHACSAAPPQEIEVEIPASDAPVPALDTVVVSMSDFQPQPKRTHPNHRLTPRYEPKRQVTGNFRDVRFTVLQISGSGLRIKHDDTLRPGDEQRVSVALVRQGRSFVFRARVVWSIIGASFCISGLHVTENDAQLREVVGTLKGAHELQNEDEVKQHKAPPAIVGVSDDAVASIIRAYRTFTADPVEAGKWYARVRVAATSDAVREAAAPMRARDREEILGLWEYLDRKIDVGPISNVVNWLRQTRSAAAV